MVAAFSYLYVGRGLRCGQEPRNGFVIEVGGQQVGGALPVVAAEAALLFAQIAFRAGRGFPALFVRMLVFMGSGLGFLTGVKLGGS